MAAHSIILLFIISTVGVIPRVSAMNNVFIDTTKETATHLSARPAGSKNKELDFDVELLQKILQQKKAARFLLGQSKKKQNIEAWYFPGTSKRKALVVGGVHGTELSGIEITEALIQTLIGGTQSY